MGLWVVFPRVGQHGYQEAGVFNLMLVYASCVTAIIIIQILMENSINLEILVQKEIEACLWEQSCMLWKASVS